MDFEICIEFISFLQQLNVENNKEACNINDEE